MLKENIKKLRKANRMTLEQVADYIGVKKSTLQRYESGVISNIPSEKIEKLASCFKVPPAALMGWDVETDFLKPRDPLPDMVTSVATDNASRRIILQYASKEILVYEKTFITSDSPSPDDIFCIGCSFEGAKLKSSKLDNFICTLPNIYYNKITSSLYGIITADDSMNQIIPKGTYAICTATLRFSDRYLAKNGAIIAVCIGEGQSAILRKFYRIDDMVILKPASYDPTYKPMTFIGEQLENIYFVGELVGFASPLLDDKDKTTDVP